MSKLRKQLIRFDKEGDLIGGQKVLYNHEYYTIGNRYHGLIELYKNNRFIVNVTIEEIKKWNRLSNN